MNDAADKVDINLNQNLWGLVVGLSGIGVAEYFELHRLLCFSQVVSVIMLLSLVCTTFAYTLNYCRKRLRP
jgi:cytochrome c oxidase subunit IV